MRKHTLKPVATIRDPPASEKDRNGGPDRIPERQGEVSEQTEKRENDPEHFPLHELILARLQREEIRIAI